MKKKYTSQESYYARMNKLADVKGTSVNESSTRNLGTLIDIEKAANGVAYGIIKEQHKYYIKKGGINENQDVADFAYIGGLGNVTEFEYSKLAEARKNRNMLLKNINEGFTAKVNPSGSKSLPKKGMLTEDKAGKEIAGAESKLGDLETATATADAPAPAPTIPDDGAAEMDAGLDAMDAPAEEPVADMTGGLPPQDGAELPVDDAGADPLAGGDDELPVDDGMGSDSGEEVAVEDPESEATREIEKSLGKLTNTLRKTELTEPQVKSYVNSFLSAFKDDFPEIDIEDRKEMAEKITKIVPPEDIEDLGQNVEDTEGGDEIPVPEPEEELAEEECAECGGFAEYATSRGHDAESMKECGEEEMTNMVSGYANAHGEGQNDGDFKAIALFITPEIIEKLKGEYGHDDFANQVEPFSNEMNETTAEDRDAQINELFAGLKGAMGGAKKGIQNIGQGIKQAGQDVAAGVQQAGTNIKQGYHGGKVNAEVKKLEDIAANLGTQIDSLNKRMEKAGQEPVNVKSILRTISNKVAGAGRSADLSQFKLEEDSMAVAEPIDGTGIEKPVNEEGSMAVAEPIDGTGIEKPVNEEGIPVDSVEVQPPMEEEVNIKVSEKAGKKLSPDNTPEVEMKESVEKVTEDQAYWDDMAKRADGEKVDAKQDKTSQGASVNQNDVVAAQGGRASFDEGEEEEDVLDLTKHEEPEMPIISGVDAMGGGVVKPEGAEITTVEVTKDSVNVTMNEAEVKLRKYIRNRLEEKAGIKKPRLNENKKSATMAKLDRVIDKQFDLFESVTMEAADELNEVLGFSFAEKFAKINPQDPAAVEGLFQQAFKNILINPKMQAVARAAQNTAPEEKYAILQQYVEGGGGTLRLGDTIDSLVFAPKEVKDAAVHSRFQHGGTQGKTQLGGV